MVSNFRKILVYTGFKMQTHAWAKIDTMSGKSLEFAAYSPEIVVHTGELLILAICFLLSTARSLARGWKARMPDAKALAILLGDCPGGRPSCLMPMLMQLAEFRFMVLSRI
jgi:hypothetical protein